MFLPIGNTPRPYAWGSTTAIAELLGTEPSGGAEAELWLGAHPGSPSRILEPALAGGAEDLAAWIAADPQAALGLSSTERAVSARPATAVSADGAPQLPFLLKVLAAGSPLSLQAHPTTAQAIEGFAREEEAGIPRDAAHRNYKDAGHKPEIVVAVSERYSALSGFRDRAATRAVVAALRSRALPVEEPVLDALADRLGGDGGQGDDGPALADTVSWLLGGPGGTPADAAALHEELIAAVTRIALAAAAAPEGALEDDRGLELDGEVAEALATVRLLAGEYPGDPGIVLSLLLNTVHLQRGEALYLPAGNIHAYLEGLGIELMAASDNVLRGGLTPKHIDVPELLSVLEFVPLPPPYLIPDAPAEGVRIFRPGVPEFQLVELTAEAPAERRVRPEGPAILLCTAGEWSVRGTLSSRSLARGEALYVTPDEGELVLDGVGAVFLATEDRR